MSICEKNPFVGRLGVWFPAKADLFVLPPSGGAGARGLRIGRGWLVAVVALVWASVASYQARAQSEPVYAWTNFAGQPGGPGNADGLGSAARFNHPAGIAVDNAGNAYVADFDNHKVRKVTPEGVVTTLLASPGGTGTNDGPGRALRIYGVWGVAVDSTGNVYVTGWNHTIRKVTPAGVVTTLAGSEWKRGSADGTGSAARFDNPARVAVDSTGNLFVTDRENHTVRKVSAAGVVTTLAGSPGAAGTNDGLGSNARFAAPSGVALDRAGNVFVADAGNHTIRKVTPAGVVTTLAGIAGGTGTNDGTSSAARFLYPVGVAVDTVGNVLVADSGNHTIRKVTPVGQVTTLVGLPLVSGSADGRGRTARFSRPMGVAVNSAGDVYVTDCDNHTIRKVTPTGVVTTLAGCPENPGDADGPGNAARFFFPAGVALDRAGILFVADKNNRTIRKATPQRVVATLAASAARFDGPVGVAVDSVGNVFVGDTENHTIWKVTPEGILTTLAGSRKGPGSADGRGSVARFDSPVSVAVDSVGNVFVADMFNHTVRKVTPTGEVTTLAGKSGVKGSADGPGSAARFRAPASAALDGAGNLFVADWANHTIRKVTPVGLVMTLAGSAEMSGSTDGMGMAARFHGPYGVAVDSAGNVFVADGGNHTIRKVTPEGVVSTIGGIAGVIGGADGIGNAANFAWPRGIAVDSAGALYVADSGNNRITKGTPTNP